MLRALLVGLVLLGCCTASLASATTARAPSPYATITSAIASGADTVLVENGTFPEDLVIDRPIALMGAKSDNHPRYSTPSIRSLSVPSAYGSGGQLVLQSLRFSGPVTIQGRYQNTIVEACRFDSGFQAGGGYGRMTGCQINGNASTRWYCGDIGMNTILRGTLGVTADCTHYIHDNLVIGPAPVGIQASYDCIVRRNRVEGCTIGISAGCADLVSENEVTDCSGDGIVAGYDRYCNAHVYDNVVRRVGGVGYRLEGSTPEAARNVADSTGLDGILVPQRAWRLEDNRVTAAGGDGIRVMRDAFRVRRNQVLGAAGAGIRVATSDSLEHNRVGRSGGSGIVVEGSPARLHHNTSYLNVGAAYAISGDAAAGDSILNNIGYGSSHGLLWSGTGIPVLACNDWYANLQGQTLGVSPGVTDTSINPLFCGLQDDDVSLSSISALLGLVECGQVGAVGLGCDYPPVADAVDRPLDRHLLAVPQPASAGVRLLWTPDLEATAVEVFDVTGARRHAARLEPGRTSYAWPLHDEGGRRVAPGVYFARVSGPGGTRETRIVVR
jgi:hypothetical protein